MTQFFEYSIPLPPWLAITGFAAVWVTLSLILERIFKTHIRRWAEKTGSRVGILLVEAFHGPFLILLLLIGGQVALGALDLTPKMERFAKIGISLATALIVMYAGVKLYHGLLMEYGQRYEPIKPSLGILNLLGKALIIVIGLLITLDSLNISISPLLTTLGIGGLAVALAFKDTLANFFSGLYILADEPIRAGDYVKLEGGPEGYVEEVGWRSTRIRTLPNNIVVIPNSKVSESIITNYFLPERRMALLLPIGVAYGSDSRKVEKILVEEATRAASEVPGLLADPLPFARFMPGFGDSSLNFTLICQVGEFADQYPVQHELRHRIYERFKKEGIEIPFPQRTVHLRKERD